MRKLDWENSFIDNALSPNTESMLGHLFGIMLDAVIKDLNNPTALIELAIKLVTKKKNYASLRCLERATMICEETDRRVDEKAVVAAFYLSSLYHKELIELNLRDFHSVSIREERQCLVKALSLLLELLIAGSEEVPSSAFLSRLAYLLECDGRIAESLSVLLSSTKRVGHDISIESYDHFKKGVLYLYRNEGNKAAIKSLVQCLSHQPVVHGISKGHNIALLLIASERLGAESHVMQELGEAMGREVTGLMWEELGKQAISRCEYLLSAVLLGKAVEVLPTESSVEALYSLAEISFLLRDLEKGEEYARKAYSMHAEERDVVHWFMATKLNDWMCLISKQNHDIFQLIDYCQSYWEANKLQSASMYYEINISQDRTCMMKSVAKLLRGLIHADSERDLLLHAAYAYECIGGISESISAMCSYIKTSEAGDSTDASVELVLTRFAVLLLYQDTQQQLHHAISYLERALLLMTSMEDTGSFDYVDITALLVIAYERCIGTEGEMKRNACANKLDEFFKDVLLNWAIIAPQATFHFKSGDVWEILGLRAIHECEYPLALIFLKKASVLVDRKAKMLYLMAEIYYIWGDVVRAEELVREAVTIQKQDRRITAIFEAKRERDDREAPSDTHSLSLHLPRNSLSHAIASHPHSIEIATEGFLIDEQEVRYTVLGKERMEDIVFERDKTNDTAIDKVETEVAVVADEEMDIVEVEKNETVDAVEMEKVVVEKECTIEFKEQADDAVVEKQGEVVVEEEGTEEDTVEEDFLDIKDASVTVDSRGVLGTISSVDGDLSCEYQDFVRDVQELLQTPLGSASLPSEWMRRQENLERTSVSPTDFLCVTSISHAERRHIEAEGGYGDYSVESLVTANHVRNSDKALVQSPFFLSKVRDSPRGSSISLSVPVHHTDQEEAQVQHRRRIRHGSPDNMKMHPLRQLSKKTSFQSISSPNLGASTKNELDFDFDNRVDSVEDTLEKLMQRQQSGDSPIALVGLSVPKSICSDASEFVREDISMLKQDNKQSAQQQKDNNSVVSDSCNDIDTSLSSAVVVNDLHWPSLKDASSMIFLVPSDNVDSLLRTLHARSVRNASGKQRSSLAPLRLRSSTAVGDQKTTISSTGVQAKTSLAPLRLRRVRMKARASSNAATAQIF